MHLEGAQQAGEVGVVDRRRQRIAVQAERLQQVGARRQAVALEAFAIAIAGGVVVPGADTGLVEFLQGSFGPGSDLRPTAMSEWPTTFFGVMSG